MLGPVQHRVDLPRERTGRLAAPAALPFCVGTTIRPSHQAAGPKEPIIRVQASLTHPWRHWALIRILTWREISGRYRGSLLGSFWSLLTPLLMLGVYTLVFG